MTIAEIARANGVKYRTLYGYLRQGMPVDLAVSRCAVASDKRGSLGSKPLKCHCGDCRVCRARERDRRERRFAGLEEECKA